ncbi:MAG: HAD hydrolase-like protein [Patescibacteria group bacterium]
MLAERFSLFVVTSTTTGAVSRFLEQHGILSSFKQVLGSDIDTNKSRKITNVLKSENMSPVDCLFITDTLGDIREAGKVGVQSIAVTWGFHERADLEKGSPYAIVSTVEELTQKIQVFFG